MVRLEELNKYNVWDIMELSDDLNRHSLIEERILIPCVESLENAKP